MASRILIAYLAMVFKMVGELPLGVWEWWHCDSSVQRVAMFTYMGQTRIQASRWTFWLHIKLLTIEESYTHINITQIISAFKHATQHPHNFEKWLTIITTFATFTYFHIIHPKFILGFLEKIIQTFEKKHIPSQLTRCK